MLSNGTWHSRGASASEDDRGEGQPAGERAEAVGEDVAGDVAQESAQGRPDDRAERPAAVHEPERESLRQADAVAPAESSDHARREERAQEIAATNDEPGDQERLVGHPERERGGDPDGRRPGATTSAPRRSTTRPT